MKVKCCDTFNNCYGNIEFTKSDNMNYCPFCGKKLEEEPNNQ